MASFAEFIAEEFQSEQREPRAPWHMSFVVWRGDESERTHLAFHIFNGVFQAVREFLETREPELIAFATKRDELARVYQTYLKREAPAIQKLGYILESPQRVDPYVEFILCQCASLSS